MPSNHLILCCPLLLLSSIFPSIRVFSNESDLRLRWPKYWSFSFSIIPSNEHPGLVSFRMDWLDLLAVQGTLKSLLHHSLKASTLQKRQVALLVKNPPAIARDARDTGSIPGLERSAGVGSGKPLQYSCPENTMDTEAWRATVHGVTKSRTQLSTLKTLGVVGLVFFKCFKIIN